MLNASPLVFRAVSEQAFRSPQLRPFEATMRREKVLSPTTPFKVSR